jgi:hypothetical protein
MLQRWQRSGIGHTLVIKHVEAPADESSAWNIESVFGSMPRIEPHWYPTTLTAPYLTADSSGGLGENGNGEKYATLGGGLKRWRTPVVKYGRWYNIVPKRDREHWVNSNNGTALSERVAELKEMVGKMTPEEKKAAILQRIDIARENLRRRPASCTNRIRREEAFAELYALDTEHFGLDKKTTDEQNRELEDYVFAELVYDKSKTCCWNRTTEAMAEIILQFNTAHVYDEASKSCNPPVVFKARDGGYELFAEYAASLGRQAEWVAWTADESCPQAPGLVEDAEAEVQSTPLCDIYESVLDGIDGGAETVPVNGDPCGDVDWEGYCHGTTVIWCQDERIETYSCSATNRACGWDDAAGYAWCLDD